MTFRFFIFIFFYSDAAAQVDKEEPEGYSDEELHDIYRLGPPVLTSPEKPCDVVSEELNFRLENISLNLCDLRSQSKFGINYCKDYYYGFFSNSSDLQIQKRSGEKTSSRKKSGPTFQKEPSFTEIAEPNATSRMIYHLQQFTLYVFYIRACNEDFNGKELCSSVLQTSARTLKNPNADDIPDVSVKVVNQFDVVISWSTPSDPNAFILAYNIYYRKDLENSKNQLECITQDKYLRDRNVTLRMLPGGYYIMVQAVSYAGPGNFSEIKYIEISGSGSNKVWYIVGAIFIVILATLSIFGITYLRMKRRHLLENIQLIANINPDYAGLDYEADEWEMDRDDIELHDKLGEGRFGRVFLGRIISKDMQCAVKTVNDEASVQERMRFLAEASTMKGFTNGPHVVNLYGVVSKSQPPLVIMELMHRGDLKRYLLELAAVSKGISSNEIYRMAIEIADGLAYLTSRKYVHRDLAARNCMVSNDKTVKIGDFGKYII